MAPSSDDLGIEIGKIREHERAVDDEYKRLIEGYGNPRRELRPQSLMECAGSR
jgi:hypothetical protein